MGLNNYFRRRKIESSQSMEESTHTESQNLILNLIGKKSICNCHLTTNKPEPFCRNSIKAFMTIVKDLSS